MQKRLEKQNHWNQILSRWEQYEGTKVEFCRAEGISMNTFDYWKRKLSRGTDESKNQDSTPAFIPVQITEHRPV